MSNEHKAVADVDSTTGLANEKGSMTDNMEGLEDNEKLIASVAKGLEEFFDEEVDDAPGQKQVIEPGQKQVIEPEQKQVIEPEQKQVTEIPYNHVRAAVRQGWKEEDIQKLADADPAMALKTMQNIFESSKNLSDRFAQLGRAQGSQPAPEQATHAPVQGQPQPKGFVDIDKLTEQFGEDPLINTVIKPMNDALIELRNQSQQSHTMPTPATAPAQRTPAELVPEIATFFGDEHLHKCYGDFYGVSNVDDDLTLAQLKNRREVLVKADQIIAGAEAQGIDMSVTEALESAHMLVSDPVKQAAIRREIKASAVKRSSGISLRPSSTATGATEQTKPQTQEELERNVAAKLNNIQW